MKEAGQLWDAHVETNLVILKAEQSSLIVSFLIETDVIHPGGLGEVADLWAIIFGQGLYEIIFKGRQRNDTANEDAWPPLKQSLESGSAVKRTKEAFRKTFDLALRMGLASLEIEYRSERTVIFGSVEDRHDVALLSGHIDRVRANGVEEVRLRGPDVLKARYGGKDVVVIAVAGGKNGQTMPGTAIWASKASLPTDQKRVQVRATPVPRLEDLEVLDPIPSYFEEGTYVVLIESATEWL